MASGDDASLYDQRYYVVNLALFNSITFKELLRPNLAFNNTGSKAMQHPLTLRH